MIYSIHRAIRGFKIQITFLVEYSNGARQTQCFTLHNDFHSVATVFTSTEESFGSASSTIQQGIALASEIEIFIVKAKFNITMT